MNHTNLIQDCLSASEGSFVLNMQQWMLDIEVMQVFQHSKNIEETDERQPRERNYSVQSPQDTTKKTQNSCYIMIFQGYYSVSY